MLTFAVCVCAGAEPIDGLPQSEFFIIHQAKVRLKTFANYQTWMGEYCVNALLYRQINPSQYTWLQNWLLKQCPKLCNIGM
jgi:hypothetical protein